MPLLKILLSNYDPEVERVGFVMKDGSVIEVENVCDDPKEGFDVKGEDILRYTPHAVATWHSHPGADANLSVNDYETFLNWPELDHYIVAENEVRHYIVEDGDILLAD